MVSALQRCPKKLCNDLVTNANLNGRIVSLKKLRLEFIAINALSFLYKHAGMKISNVFYKFFYIDSSKNSDASHFLNSTEPE